MLQRSSGEPSAESVDAELGKTPAPGVKFHYEYDFGTTTDPTPRAVSERANDLRGQPIRILARNEPPTIACAGCGQPAVNVCSQCILAGEGWLCGACAGARMRRRDAVARGQLPARRHLRVRRVTVPQPAAAVGAPGSVSSTQPKVRSTARFQSR